MSKLSFSPYLSSFLLILSFQFFSISIQAKTSIAVTDYHLKLLIDLVTKKNSSLVEINFPFNIQGDPHHYQPNIEAVKTFFKSDLFIINQSGDSWKKSFEKKLEGTNQAANILKLAPLDAYKEDDKGTAKTLGNSHSLAHFWLFPKIGCHYFQKIIYFLKSKKIEINDKLKCPYQINKQIHKLKNNLPWHSIIMTHDATMAFFNLMAKDKLIILKSSHHGDRIGAKDLKKVYQVTAKDQKKPILWIFESQLETPTRLARRKREFDHFIEMDTLGKDLVNSNEILNNLQEKLLNLIQQGKTEVSKKTGSQGLIK